MAKKLRASAGRGSSNISDVVEVVDVLKDVRKGEIQAFVGALRNESTHSLLNSDEVFSSLIELAIQDYGLVQKDLAQALGMSPAAVGRWACGETTPKPYTRQAIVMTIADLIGRRLQDGG